MAVMEAVAGLMVEWAALAAPGLMVLIVADPVWLEPSVTVTVKLLPATVGVTLALFSTPDVKVPDVPVAPAVPPKVTVLPKLVAVLLPASWAVIVVMVKGVPAVCGDEMEEITKWSTEPAVMLNAVLSTGVNPELDAVNL